MTTADKAAGAIRDALAGVRPSDEWRVSPEHPTIIRRDYRPISDEGELIGSAAGYNNSGHFPSDAEAIANARLIAAASPAALVAILDEMDRLRKDAQRWQKWRPHMQWQINPNRVATEDEVDAHVDSAHPLAPTKENRA